MFRKVWLIPSLLALSTLFGLLAALLGTGFWKLLSWITLAIPLIVLGWKIRQHMFILTIFAMAVTIDVGAQTPGHASPVSFADTARRDTIRLKEVIVTGDKKKYSRDSSGTVAKMPLKYIENPQVSVSVSGELMRDQLITVYADALKNIPGVVMQLENNSAGGTVTSRGFSTQSWLRNGVPGIVGSATLDPINIETIEAIKGPSGALYGSSLVSFGGLFNRVTKKPQENFSSEIAYTAGGYGLSRLTLDLNAPFNKDKTVLFRLNAAKHSETSFQDAGYKNYFFANPSLVYRPDDRTTLTIEAEWQREKGNSFYRIFADGSYATGVRSPKDLGIDWNKRWLSDDISINAGVANVYLQLDRELGKHWHSRTNYTYLSNNASGANGYLSMRPGNDSLDRYVTWYEYNNNAVTDIQQNFVNDDRFGGHRNRLLVGFEYYSISTKLSTPGGIAFDRLNVAKPGAAYASLTRTALMDRVKALTFQKNRQLQNTYSAYIQDVFNITGSLIAMASVRVDRFDNRGVYNQNRDTTTGKYAQTAVSPKFGLLWQAVPDRVALFANYMNGFSNIAPVPQPDGSTSSFKPVQADQWEGGIKLDIAPEKLTGSVSYYDIRVKNITRQDIPDRPTYTVQNGTQYSRGIEVSLASAPVAGLHIMAGYAYNDSKTEKANPTLDGLRPISAGPAHTGNIWISYGLPGALHGFGLGFGGNYASANKVILSTTSLYTLPAYTVLGAALSYEQKNYRLSCKLDNLTNEKYFVGWSTTIPQMPTRFSASLAVRL